MLLNDWRPMFSYTANLHRLGAVLLDTNSAWERCATLVRPRERAMMLASVKGPQYPWYWSAGVLAGLLGLSLCILSLRVKSLDRLK